jgi:hypothetical protein
VITVRRKKCGTIEFRNQKGAIIAMRRRKKKTNLMNPIVFFHLVLIIGCPIGWPFYLLLWWEECCGEEDAQEHPLISVMEGVTPSIETWSASLAMQVLPKYIYGIISFEIWYIGTYAEYRIWK